MYWHVFPTYAEAKDAVWRDPQMLFSIIPDEIIARKNEQELVIYFKNGSVLQLKGADKPERLLGSGPVGVVLDEFATMKYETWERIVEPIVRANDGWVWFIGTPKGKNHLYDMYIRGQQGHKEWFSNRLRASTSGIYTKEQLDNARASMSTDLFNQELETKFLEGVGTVFRNIEYVLHAEEKQPEEGVSYVMGLDLAKVTDWTVMTVYDRRTNQQVFQERFQKYDWTFQVQKIKSVVLRYNRCLVIMDATGVGDPIADELMRNRLPVLPIKITETTKRELIEKLQLWVDKRAFQMLPIEETQLEFENFGYDIGPTGKISYRGKHGFHDDIVLSHALAIKELNPFYRTITQKEPTLIQRHFQKMLRREVEGEFEFNAEDL